MKLAAAAAAFWVIVIAIAVLSFKVFVEDTPQPIKVSSPPAQTKPTSCKWEVFTISPSWDELEQGVAVNGEPFASSGRTIVLKRCRYGNKDPKAGMGE